MIPLPHFTRRHFVKLTTLGIAGTSFRLAPAASSQELASSWDPDRPYTIKTRPLRIQPILMYRLPTPRPQTSWKSWGGVQTEAQLADEIDRIKTELTNVTRQAEFPLHLQPLHLCTEAAALQDLTNHDVTLLYACSGSGDLLRACLDLVPNSIVFVRRRSGPAYYWFEALSVRYLDTRDANADPPPASEPKRPTHVDDVVVDNYDEVLWRLRALHALQNLAHTRILALGGPWGKYAADAPQLAEKRYGIKIVDLPYTEFEPQLQRAQANNALLRAAAAWTDRYLRLAQTTLETERVFVERAFVLYHVISQLLDEHNAGAFTIKSCMNTIMPMSATTACLTLTLLNDEGRVAFCESDFVVIPAGLLLHLIARRPVFLHNSTFPAAGEVTCAHCTSPRRMDTQRYEPARIQTHFESDYGAATKVDFPVGQPLTFIDPEYTEPRWLGFRGTVRNNPDYAICRSQQDVEIHGNWKQLVREVRDSHWLMVYGDFLAETGYAARKLGLRWDTL